MKDAVAAGRGAGHAAVHHAAAAQARRAQGTVERRVDLVDLLHSLLAKVKVLWRETALLALVLLLLLQGKLKAVALGQKGAGGGQVDKGRALLVAAAGRVEREVGCRAIVVAGPGSLAGPVGVGGVFVAAGRGRGVGW